MSGRVVLIDCCTLWATNYFSKFAREEGGTGCCDVDAVLEEMRGEFDRFTAQEATFLFVTNEIGLGGTSANDLQRRFTDLLGWFNQYLAARADEVYFIACGIPVKIK